MKAIAYLAPGAPDVLDLHDVPAPEPGPGDLLVDVRAVGLNPADPKIRAGLTLQGEGPQVLGFDAAGVVRAVGTGVEGFRPGDEVFYAGDVTRAGANAPLQVVDAAIVGKKPDSLDFEEAAALPLTSLTAWEVLFDRLEVPRDADERILVLGAAGGVGSVMLQALRAETALEVVATASRPASQAWVRELGAAHVVNHREPLPPQVEAAGGPVEYAVGLNGVGPQVAALAEMIAPQGKLALVDDPSAFDIFAFKLKSISVHWEFMFTRSMFQTADRATQGAILRRVAELVDAGRLRTTLKERLGPLSVTSLRAAHARIMEGKTIGKGVFRVEGDPTR